MKKSKLKTVIFAIRLNNPKAEIIFPKGMFKTIRNIAKVIIDSTLTEGKYSAPNRILTIGPEKITNKITTGIINKKLNLSNLLMVPLIRLKFFSDIAFENVGKNKNPTVSAII